MMRDDGLSLAGFFLIGRARFHVKPMASVDCFRLVLDAYFAVNVVEDVGCKGCEGKGVDEAGIVKAESRSSLITFKFVDGETSVGVVGKGVDVGVVVRVVVDVGVGDGVTSAATGAVGYADAGIKAG